MKKLLLGLLFVPLVGNTQVINSIANGNFYNPLTWSCFCIPAMGDSLVINHTVTMDNDVYYTSGQIKISASGTLTEGGVDRALWADGNGSIVNMGSLTSHYFLVTGTGWVQNSGAFNVDSLLNQATITNSGTITAYDLMNDEMATLTNSGTITSTNNMHNQGHYNNNVGALIQVYNDFSNCNTQTLNAIFTNNGNMCIGHDFSNCGGDTLKGSGYFYVANDGLNAGVFDQSITFNIPAGNNFLNTGVIGSGVTMAGATCNLAVTEVENTEFMVWPNPARNELNTSVSNELFELVDCTGKTVKSGKITGSKIILTDMKNGVYLLKVGDHPITRIIKY